MYSVHSGLHASFSNVRRVAHLNRPPIHTVLFSIYTFDLILVFVVVKSHLKAVFTTEVF